MRISNQQNSLLLPNTKITSSNSSFRALHIDKRLQHPKMQHLLEVVKNRKDIQLAAKNFELFLGAYSTALFNVGLAKKCEITAQAAEGIEKDLFGRIKLVGNKSHIIVFNEQNKNDTGEDFNLYKELCDMAKKDSYKLREYINSGKIDDMFLSQDDWGNLRAHSASLDDLIGLYTFLAANRRMDLLAKIHLTQNKNGELPVHCCHTRKRLRCVCDNLRNFEPTLKKIFTTHPIDHNGKERPSLVQTYIYDSEFGPIIKSLFGISQLFIDGLLSYENLSKDEISRLIISNSELSDLFSKQKKDSNSSKKLSELYALNKSMRFSIKEVFGINKLLLDGVISFVDLSDVEIKNLKLNDTDLSNLCLTPDSNGNLPAHNLTLEQLVSLHKILKGRKDLIVQMHLMQNKNGELPIHTHKNQSERMIQELYSTLEDHKEVLKKIFTSRPRYLQDDSNIVEDFIYNNNLESIFRAVLDPKEYAQYKEYDRLKRQYKIEEEVEQLLQRVSLREPDIMNNSYILSKCPSKLVKYIKDHEIDISKFEFRDLNKWNMIFKDDLKSYTDLMLSNSGEEMNIINLNYGKNLRVVAEFLNLIKNNLELLKKVRNTLEGYSSTNISTTWTCESLISKLDQLIYNVNKSVHANNTSYTSKDIDTMPITANNILLILKDEDKTFEVINKHDKFVHNVLDFMLNKAKPSEKDAICEALSNKKDIDYDKKDQNDISILEKVINAEDGDLLKLITTKTLTYSPELDYVYANIQDEKFKSLVDNITLRFPDIEKAIKLSSKTTLDILLSQFSSPFYAKSETKTKIPALLKNATLDFRAYMNVRFKEYV